MNTEFTVSVAGDDELAETSAMIVDSVGTETTPQTDTPTEPPADTPTDEPDTETTTTGGQPGFGVAIAIVALLAAALLAIRRD